jgi:hypothetical protein
VNIDSIFRPDVVLAGSSTLGLDEVTPNSTDARLQSLDSGSERHLTAQSATHKDPGRVAIQGHLQETTNRHPPVSRVPAGPQLETGSCNRHWSGRPSSTRREVARLPCFLALASRGSRALPIHPLSRCLPCLLTPGSLASILHLTIPRYSFSQSPVISRPSRDKYLERRDRVLGILDSSWLSRPGITEAE